MTGRKLRGRELDVDLTKRRPPADRRYIGRLETMSGWEARIAHERQERLERNEAIVAGIVVAVLAMLVVALILAAGPVPR